jgi:hypothetical protein
MKKKKSNACGTYFRADYLYIKLYKHGTLSLQAPFIRRTYRKYTSLNSQIAYKISRQNNCLLFLANRSLIQRFHSEQRAPGNRKGCVACKTPREPFFYFENAPAPNTSARLDHNKLIYVQSTTLIDSQPRKSPSSNQRNGTATRAIRDETIFPRPLHQLERHHCTKLY